MATIEELQNELTVIRTTEIETLKDCLSFIEKSIKENNKIYYITIDINKEIEV
ncbi:hypothetical protein [Brachyspira sp.]|uniref:hypothetical protein n=1 Tax=Brachyspira sp. TaxID=1977261 RepID=UPI003D7DEA99